MPKAIAVLTLALLGALWSLPARAYLDPGTGSVVLQIILGGLAGAAVADKLYWYKIKSVIGLGGKAAPGEEGKPRDRPH